MPEPYERSPRAAHRSRPARGDPPIRTPARELNPSTYRLTCRRRRVGEPAPLNADNLRRRLDQLAEFVETRPHLSSPLMSGRLTSLRA